MLIPVAGIAQKQTPPNVIIFMSDDVGLGDLSCYGSELTHTPRIDEFATQGMQFMNHYTSCSVSAPTRYSIITGIYPSRDDRRNHTTTMSLWPSLDRLSIAQMFRDQGYKSAAIGKWHLGYGERDMMDFNDRIAPGPLELGFDYHLGIASNHNDNVRTYVENHELLNRIPGVRFEMADPTKGKRVQGIHPERRDDEVDMTLTNRAMQFIRENRNEPFFLYFTPCGVHTHVTPSERFRGLSDAGQYGDYILEMDSHVGEVLDLLDELSLADNTIIIYMSDNGGQMSDVSSAGKGLLLRDESKDVGVKSRTAKRDATKLGHKTSLNYRGCKASVWEGGFRTPFIIRWGDKIPAGVKSHTMISSVDLMATFADIIGAKIPKGSAIDSRSFREALTKGAPLDNRNQIREDLIMRGNKSYVVYNYKEWKMVAYELSAELYGAPKPKGDGKDELYNIITDPSESSNVAAKYPEVVEMLNARLRAELERTKRVK